MLASVVLWVLIGTHGLPIFDEPKDCKQALQKSLKAYPKAQCIKMRIYNYV